jgi:hypothetical protein
VRRLFLRATADAWNPHIAATVATTSSRAITNVVGPSDPYRHLQAPVCVGRLPDPITVSAGPALSLVVRDQNEHEPLTVRWAFGEMLAGVGLDAKTAPIRPRFGRHRDPIRRPRVVMATLCLRGEEVAVALGRSGCLCFTPVPTLSTFSLLRPASADDASHRSVRM